MERDPLVCSMLVDMHADCGLLAKAQTLIAGYDSYLGESKIVTSPVIPRYWYKGGNHEGLTILACVAKEG